MKQLWSDERVKKEAGIEDPRRGDVVAKLKKMRDEYEALVESLRKECADYHKALITDSVTSAARIAQLEAELIACQSQLAATELFKPMQ